MSERKQLFIIVVLGLIFGIVLFGTILTNNYLRIKNLELNAHILQDCKIDYEEYQNITQDDIEINGF